MRNKKIFLMGMPSSGKTTLGKRVAPVLNLPFLDLDHVIEQSEGMSIPDIFKEKGEDYFRKTEARLLREVTEKEDMFLLSCGGGTPCYHDGIDFMNGHGLTVFIDVPAEELTKRMVGRGTETRPLFTGMETTRLLNELRERIDTRLPHYSKAKIQIKGESIDPEMVLGAILDEEYPAID
ncbi:shikimate kinase [Fulvitalea axinellae]|uniref:Shikimate kinase n=1 Tax=Fulvitalea axinellae TaxID=1182444 RepID=A0AAU9D547_9BACT|nr:shikimate kinase [Fulvitalea axinellae]